MENTFKSIANALMQASKQIEEDFGYKPKLGPISQSIISEYGNIQGEVKQKTLFEKAETNYQNNISAGQVAKQELREAQTQQLCYLKDGLKKLQRILSSGPVDMKSFEILAKTNGFHNITIVEPRYELHLHGVRGPTIQVEINERKEVVSAVSFG